uniref:Uncharacterized protein n=3 Tax=Brassica TaxID=3705 RepID=A0A0D3AM56_BRAOL
MSLSSAWRCLPIWLWLDKTHTNLKGGLGVPAAANDQFNVRSTSASKPVSASLSSAIHPSAEADAMVLQRASWEFAEVETTTTTTTIPRVVFSKPPSLQEAKEATDDLKDAINLKQIFCESESEEDSEAKPIQLLEILEDMKLKAVQLMENVSSYFGGLFRSESFTENGEERKRTLLNDPTSLFGLAVCVIFMVVMKRA